MSNDFSRSYSDPKLCDLNKTLMLLIYFSFPKPATGQFGKSDPECVIQTIANEGNQSEGSGQA